MAGERLVRADAAEALAGGPCVSMALELEAAVAGSEEDCESCW